MLSMTLPQYRRRECTLNGQTVGLTGTETDLLATFLVSNPDHFISGNDLIESMYPDPDFEPDWALTILWRRVHNLRHKGIAIENAWGRGWRIPRQAREHVQLAEAA